MSGFDETPATATLAKGFAGFQLSHDGKSVYYTLTVTDASTKLVAVHLHLAPRGTAGPIVVPLCTEQTTACETEGVVTQGSFTEADFTGPFENDNMQRLIDEARIDNVYVNIHMMKYPGGVCTPARRPRTGACWPKSTPSGSCVDCRLWSRPAATMTRRRR
jgi:hypothetical protein